METSKEICVFFGSEENAYEEEFLGTFPTVEDAKKCVAENLANDGMSEEIDEITDEGFDGFNNQDYRVVYVIGEREICQSYLTGLREDFLEEMEDEDEWEMEDEDE